MSAGNARGHFGAYGGRYVPETLISALDELDAARLRVVPSEEFQRELNHLLHTYAGRPTALSFAKRVTDDLGGARVYLKREDLAHTGAHKINNVLGQALLARAMGKRRVIAETGAGQHGVATATACALLGLDCEVYQGAEDVERQSLNVFRMELLGARVIPVESGSRTLKDAINEAMRDWVTNVRDDLLLHRLDHGATSVSHAGARLPARDRHRGAAPDPGDRGPASRRAGGLRRRRLQRHGPLPSVPGGHPGAHGRLRGRRGRGRPAGATAPR